MRGVRLALRLRKIGVRHRDGLFGVLDFLGRNRLVGQQR